MADKNDAVAQVVAEDGLETWVGQIEGLVSEIAESIKEEANEKYAIREGEALFLNVNAIAIYAHALHMHAVFLNESGKLELADSVTQQVIALATLVEEAQKRA
jgi:hypothetical protein